ncbi:hypothetical protein Droror1_Dr00017626 [Drosera rotundifolia]
MHLKRMLDAMIDHLECFYLSTRMETIKEPSWPASYKQFTFSKSTEKKTELIENALAPEWWLPFKYKLVQTLTDERDGSISGRYLSGTDPQLCLASFSSDQVVPESCSCSKRDLTQGPHHPMGLRR